MSATDHADPVATTILDYVLAADAAGLCAIPTADDGTKRPAGRWQQWQTRRPDEAQLRAWFAAGRHVGFGLVTGKVSGHLEMFELEGRAVAEGLLDQLVAKAIAAGLGPLLDRVTTGYTEETPSRGIHLLWRCVDGVGPSTPLARRRATPAELAVNPAQATVVLIETRGEGGFTIAAPSGGSTHPTGRPWVLVLGGFATIATITVAERDALFELARTFDRPAAAPAPARPMAGERWTTLAVTGGGTFPSDEYMAGNRCGDVLERAGFATSGREQGGGRLYTRPGKAAKDGHSAIVRDPHQRTGDERAAIYSTSVAIPTEFLSPGPDGHERALNPWQLHVALNHAGDFTEAARWWRLEHPRPPIDHIAWIDPTARTTAVTPHDPQDGAGPARAAITAADLLAGTTGHQAAAVVPPIGTHADLEAQEVGGAPAGTTTAAEVDEALAARVASDLGATGDRAAGLTRIVAGQVEALTLNQLARTIVTERAAERDQRLDLIVAVRADRFLDQQDQPAPPLLGHLVDQGHNGVLTARFKAGKTVVNDNASAALVTGEAFLGHFDVDRPRLVTALNYELTDDDQRDRLRRLGVDPAGLERLTLVNLRGRRLVITTPSGRRHLVGILQDTGAEVLSLDTYGAALGHCGLDENSNTDVRYFLTCLDEVLALAGVASSLMTAHTGRAEHDDGREHARGATVLDDWADVRMVLTKADDGTRFLYTEGRAVDLPESRLLFNEATGRLRLAGGDVGVSRKLTKADSTVDQIIELVTATPGVSKRKVEEVVEAGRGVVREAIALATRRGLIHHHGGDQGVAHRLYVGAIHHQDDPCPSPS